MNREELIFSIRNLIARPDATAVTAVLRSTPRADVADALDRYSTDELARFLAAASPRQRADIFSALPANRQDELLAALAPQVVTELFTELPSDDRADIYNRLAPEARPRILGALAQAERDDILRLAAYPEGTVGSVTTSEYVWVDADASVSSALEHVRESAPDSETVYVVYVLGSERNLIGTVSLKDLVLAAPELPVSEIMRAEPVLALADWDREQAVELIRRYDLLALPVVDPDVRMIGIVSVDDAMDAAREDDATQLARYGGTASLGGPDLDLRRSSLWKIFSTRVFWLSILTVFGILTSTFVAAQEEILTSVIVLAAFVAPIIDMGGNTGSQAATLVIRGMALGQVKLRLRDIGFVIRREIPVALALGATIAVLEIVLAYFSKGVGVEVLIVVGLTMAAVTVLGGLIGSLLPFLARAMRTDPATLSAPMITSVMDLLGVFIYFGIAYAVLGASVGL